MILRGKQLGIFDKNQRIGSQYIGVSPWIDKQIAVGVVIERKRYFSCFAELLYQLCFGLAKGSSTSKGFRAAVGRRPAVVVSPIVAIITIEVNPKRAVTIIAPVFTPHPATVGISGMVVYIAIGVDTGNKVHLQIVDKVLNFRITIVVFHEIPHLVQHLLQRGRFAGMSKGCVKHSRFFLIYLGVVGNPYPVHRPSFDGISCPNGLFG